MSKYTTELRYICETLAGQTESVGYDDVEQVITDALPSLFSFDFPIFDEEYRSVLERKIVKHYYTREICAETVGLWKLYLDRKMNEIMPYYNQLYRTELISFDPLHDVDLTKSRSTQGTEAGSGSNTSSGERESSATYGENGSYSRSVSSSDTREYSGTSGTDSEISGNTDVAEDHVTAYSDTPNNKLTDLGTLTYVSNVSRTTADDNTSSTTNTSEDTEFSNEAERTYQESVNEITARNTQDEVTESSSNSGSYSNNITTTENYIETIAGSTGGVTYSRKIAEFRKNILNIDMMIIEELSSLFFGLW